MIHPAAQTIKFRIALQGKRGFRKTPRYFLARESAEEYAIRFYSMHTWRIVEEAR